MSVQQVEKIEKIYKNKERLMNVVVFGSGSGTNLKALLKVQEGLNFRVRALFTDRNCSIIDIGKEHNIPTIYHSFVQFFKERGVSNYQDESVREAYDETVSLLIEECAKKEGFVVDLVVLAGYMRVVHRPLLEKFKMINVHPADLTVLDDEGNRLYVGANAIELALKSGEKRTRSSVHLVTEKMDQGPILVLGPWVPFTGSGPLTKGQLHNHQQKQKALSDWPAIIEAVDLISRGEVKIVDGQLRVDTFRIL